MAESPALTLFYSPRACSLACHIALEESGLPFTPREIRVREGAHKEAAYREVNPWGKIPALRVGEQVLTEAHAILTYVADRAPGHNLLPSAGTLARARAVGGGGLIGDAVADSTVYNMILQAAFLVCV